MDTDLAWFPLVLRERPPGRPLKVRIAELTRLAEPATDTPSRNCITQAAEVLNKAALIASDCGLPDLARSLCDQQYGLFEQGRPWPSWAIKLAMQPLLNIARQLIRDGHGDDAHAMLESLYAAARARTSLTIGDRAIDFRALTATPEGHKAICTLLWAALLADGTRALAQAGRWTEAAERAAAHRGIGARLLDGRQIAIIAQLTEGNPIEAAELIEQSQVAEPWEHAVQRILCVLCQSADNVASENIAAMLMSVHNLVQPADPTTTAARARIGIVALDLAASHDSTRAQAVRADVFALAAQDAYAAHDVLSRTVTSCHLTTGQGHTLRELIRTCGLRSGAIPDQLQRPLKAAVACAATTLTEGLAQMPSAAPA